MATENESLMDVINDALGEVGPAETEPEEIEGAEGSEEEGSEELGGEEGAEGEGAEGTEEEGAEEGEGEEGKEGQTRRADGTYGPKGAKPAEGKDGKPAEGKDGKPAEGKDGKPVKGAKEPDPLNDPIPKELSEATQTRMRTLITRTKDAETRATKSTEDFNFMVQGVQATGATPDQYGEVLSWLSLFNSQDPKQQATALDLLENVADRLATMIGRERTVSDPLANHPDLVAAVQKREITEKYAKEVARTRNQGTFRTELTNSNNQQVQAQQQADAERAQAKTDLNALEARLSKDPHYAAKKAHLVPILQVTFASMPPSKWAKAFEDAYKKVRLAGGAPGRGTVPKNQPMRGGKGVGGGGAGAGGSGGMNNGSGPTSMLDAVSGALARMGK